MPRLIPYGKQSLDREDIRSVEKVLKTDWITQGPTIEKFEQAIAKYCDARYAVAVSSGTAALHLACLAAGLKSGDKAITTPITFLATANAVCYCQAEPVFVDVDEATANIDVSKINAKLDPSVKAILPVHFAGLPCDMKKIHRIASARKLTVIEYAARALGAKYQFEGRWVRVGSCRHSDMTVLSFHPVKTITSGEGGVITTNSEVYYEKLRSLRTHGIVKDKKAKEIGPWYYEMRELGFNYRITDFQSALGCSQLSKITGFLNKRQQIAKQYMKAFQGMDAVTLLEGDAEKYGSANHLFVLKIDFKKLKTTRKEFMVRLLKDGIGSQVHYIPVHTQPFYRKQFGTNWGDCPIAESYYERCLSIPLYPAMTNSDVKRVIKGIQHLGGNS